MWELSTLFNRIRKALENILFAGWNLYIARTNLVFRCRPRWRFEPWFNNDVDRSQWCPIWGHSLCKVAWWGVRGATKGDGRGPDESRQGRQGRREPRGWRAKNHWRYGSSGADRARWKSKLKTAFCTPPPPKRFLPVAHHTRITMLVLWYLPLFGDLFFAFFLLIHIIRSLSSWECQLYLLDQIPNFQSNNVPLYKTGLVPRISLIETPPESEFLILKN